MGRPFYCYRLPSPNAYTLALPRKMRGSPTVNVDRLKAFVTRAGTSPAPGPVSDSGSRPLLRSRRERRPSSGGRFYQWPTEGWVRGTVARRSRAAGFSNVVRYGRTSARALGSERRS